MLLVLSAAAVAGLASIPHCVGMCGPLAGFACSRSEGWGAALRYQLGRVVSYALLGGVAGATSEQLLGLLSSPWAGAVLSWCLALALAFGSYRLWNFGEARFGGGSGALVPLRKASRTRGPLWGARWLSRMPREPGVYGLITAFLPCGALYAAVLVAAGAGSPALGAGVMAVFALTSGVGLFAAGWLASSLRGLARGPAAQVLAVVLLVGAVLLVIRPIPALTAPAEAPPSCCHH